MALLALPHCLLIVLLTSSVGIELLSSWARVTSWNLSHSETYGPIDQTRDTLVWKKYFSMLYHENNLVGGFPQVNLLHCKRTLHFVLQCKLQTLKSIMMILDRKCSRLKALLRNNCLSQVMLRWSRDACILFPRMFWFGSPSSPKIEKYIQESFENG